MSNKSSTDQYDLLELGKKYWGYIASIISIILLLTDFFQKWEDNQATMNYVVVGIAVAFSIIGLGWIAFSRKRVVLDSEKPFEPKREVVIPRYSKVHQWIAIASLGIILAGIVSGVWILAKKKTEQENKLIILIAKFDGPEEKYHLRDEILRQLKLGIKDFGDTEIVPIDEVITEAQGSALAQKWGEDNQADIVIWGWYTETETSNLNIYIENLSPDVFDVDIVDGSYNPEASLVDLETLTIQTKLASELTDLITFLVGYTRYRLADYSTGLEILNTLLQRNEISPLVDQETLLFVLGNCNYFSQNVNLAVTNYTDVIEANPDFELAYFNRARALSDLGEITYAIDDYSEAIILNPLNKDAYNNRGALYAQLGNYSFALDDLNQALSGEYTDSWDESYKYYYNRGLVHYNLGELENAIDDYSNSLRLNPSLFEGYVNRGNAYFYNEQIDKAISDFDHAITIKPTDPQVYNNRGNAYSADSIYRNYEKAINDYDKAIQMAPNFSTAFYGRGVMYYEKGDYNSAIRDLNQSVTIRPNNPNAYFYLGKTYFAIAEIELAVNSYTKAIELNPNDYEAYKDRGDIYWAIGETMKADADFQKYEEITGKKP